MFIFTKEGRTAYLAFVRNLPSQIVLLSPCVFLPKLDTFHGTEFTSIALWVSFFCMFLFAACANVLEFLEAENCRAPMRAAVKELRASGLSGWRLFFKAFWRVPKGELVSFIVVMLVAYVGFGLVAAMVFWSTGLKH